MDPIFKKIIDNHEMVDVIRTRKKTDCTVEYLKNVLDISRTTADKFYSSLQEKGIIMRTDRSTTICNDCAYFLGISIGSSNIRLVLLGLDFKPISRSRLEEYSFLKGIKEIPGFCVQESDGESFAFKPVNNWCSNANEAPQAEFRSIQETVGTAVSLFLKQAEAARNGTGPAFPLAGIGFGVTGPVDYAEKRWISAPRMKSVRDISLRDLLRHENMKKINEMEIFLAIDNNAKTSIVSEYQYLEEENGGAYSEDLALIYIGSGVGASAVINRRLLRGRSNTSGELGQIYLPRSEVAGATIESCLQTEEDYVRFLPYILNVLKCLLGIDRFILVGHNMFEYGENDERDEEGKRIHLRSKVLPAVMDQRMTFTVASTHKFCKVEEGRSTPCTAAIGAAIEAYFSMCNYDLGSSNNNRENLAFDICWR